jgi:hypothetical protein
LIILPEKLVQYKLESVVPWGRNLKEYIQMFNLTSDELKLKILDCAGGPASFNIEMTKQGYQVTSADPIYQFSVAEINQRIQETSEKVIAGLETSREDFVWQDIPSPQHLGEIRMAAMQQFLPDLPLGIEQERYITCELPNLPFQNHQFELALCSHFLFTYSNVLTKEFHLASIRELCRVATEVRIFPLLTNFSTQIAEILPSIIDELSTQGYKLDIKQVGYEFQKGGNQMLKVSQSI